MSDYDASEFFEQAILSAPSMPDVAMDELVKNAGPPTSELFLRRVARAEAQYAVIWAEELTKARNLAMEGEG